MKRSFLQTLSLILLIALAACSIRQNNEANLVFEKLAPDDTEYKNALAKQLQLNPDKLHYTFQQYIKNKGHEYLNVLIAGDNFKATGNILVTNWHKLENIKNTQGLGYSGAELKGLQIEVAENPAGATFIYKDLETIVD